MDPAADAATDRAGMAATNPAITETRSNGPVLSVRAPRVSVPLVGLRIQLFARREKAIRHPILICLTGFWIMTIVSTAVGGDTLAAALDNGKLVILAALVLNLVKTPQRYRALENTLIAFTVYIAG